MIPPKGDWPTHSTPNGIIKYLPPGIHFSSIKEIENIFVFPQSETRSKIYNGFLRYMDDLKVLVQTEFTIILDGSFITSIINPADIDIIVLLNNSDYNKIPHDKKLNFFMHHRFSNMFNNPKKIYYCDSYIINLDYIKSLTETDIFRKFSKLTYKTVKNGKEKRIDTQKQKGLVKIIC